MSITYTPLTTQTEELANAFKEKETAQNDSSTTKLIAQVATLQAENDKLVQRQIGFAAEHGPAQALEETRTTATRIELERKLIAAQFNDGEQSMEIARLKKKIVELEEV